MGLHLHEAICRRSGLSDMWVVGKVDGLREYNNTIGALTHGINFMKTFRNIFESRNFK